MPIYISFHKLLFIYQSLSTWLRFAAMRRFHCGLRVNTIILALLFKEHDTVIGISDAALCISSEYPRSQHAVATGVVNFQADIGKFQLLWHCLLLLTLVVFIL